MADEAIYVDSAGAARLLGMSVRSVRRAAVAGQLPYVRLRGEYRFLIDDLRNLTKTPPPTASPPVADGGTGETAPEV